MEFRPCIDIHDGRVKQIVGGALDDRTGAAPENFVSDTDSEYYARIYKEHELPGGHVIVLNNSSSPLYERSHEAAIRALGAYPGGLQYGGGVTPENAAEYLEAGASHVIVTSYAFTDREIDVPALDRLVSEVGREHLVLDLSARSVGEYYMVVTNRWRNYTDVELNLDTLGFLCGMCAEFLIHGVDKEGRRAGIDPGLVKMLSSWKFSPVTYAGGIRNMEDIYLMETLGHGHVNITVGSALDLFGGTLSFEEVAAYCKKASTAQ